MIADQVLLRPGRTSSADAALRTFRRAAPARMFSSCVRRCLEMTGTSFAHLYGMVAQPASPVGQYPENREYMTSAQYTISRRVSLAAAGCVMRNNHVRHLPVLEGGRLVGVICERDLLLLGSAIVCERDRVLGVFTTVDALPVLHHRLERQ